MLIGQAVGETQMFNAVPIVMLLAIGILIAFICIATVLTKKYGILALAGLVAFLLIVPAGIALLMFFSVVTRADKVTRSTHSGSVEGIKPQGDARITQEWPINYASPPNVDAIENRLLPPASAFRVTAVADPPPAAWSSADLGDFQANLYPGLVECMAPLARKIGDAIENEDMMPAVDADRENEKFVFTVYADDSLGSESEQCLDQFIDALADRFPDAHVVEDETDGHAANVKPKNHELMIYLSASYRPGKLASWSWRQSNSYGDVKCQAVGSDGKANTDVKYIKKSWVNQFDQLVSEFPQKQFVVGYSQQLSSSESLARQSAMENAQAQIRVSTLGRINTLIDESHVVDRFAQKLTRPYGDVWREAVLIDVTGEAMRGTVQIAAARAASSTSMRRGGALTAVLLLLTIVAVCFIGNAMTQGYYRRPLSWAAGAVGVGVLMVLVGVLFV